MIMLYYCNNINYFYNLFYVRRDSTYLYLMIALPLSPIKHTKFILCLSGNLSLNPQVVLWVKKKPCLLKQEHLPVTCFVHF